MLWFLELPYPGRLRRASQKDVWPWRRRLKLLQESQHQDRKARTTNWLAPPLAATRAPLAFSRTPGNRNVGARWLRPPCSKMMSQIIFGRLLLAGDNPSVSAVCCTGTWEGECWGHWATSRSTRFPFCKNFSLFVFSSPVPLSRLHILSLLCPSEFLFLVLVDDRSKV